jgi:NTP pyrophosphatase (non-canonical NTP hydrolase)
MKKEEEEKIYQEAIELFGVTSQKIMVIEEMSELTKELCKELRDRGNIENIADELADVEITLAQIKNIYGISENVKKHKDFKLKRFASRMAELKLNQTKQN